MRKNLLLSLLLTIGLSSVSFAQAKKEVKTAEVSKEKTTKETKKQVKELRKKHAYYLANNKVNRTFALSKSERKAEGLPPNKYFEQEYLLSMNPNTGRPTPENLEFIRRDLEQLRQDMLTGRIPGDASDNNWVERGPNNVGGRTRAIIFDTAAGANAVVAGGVSGGLWRNADITTTGAWTRISTFPEHVNVETIAIDPNNSNTWYVGTGETYVGGDVNGNGIWKTTDRGTTWTRVFGGGTVTTTPHAVYNLEIIAPSNAGVIRGYVTGGAAFGNPITLFTAPIELVNDGTAPTDDACEPLTPGSMTGKIALIRRGTCSFEPKVLEAENAGAIGAIIMNNVAGAGVITMAATGAGATIPSVFISKEDGDLLVANLTNLTGRFKPTPVGEYTGNEISGIDNVTDIVVKNNGGNSDIYASVADGVYADARNNSLYSPATYGLYKSTNGGSTWTKLTLPLAPSGNQTCPNDLELGQDGTIWLGTRESWTFGDGGGKVMRSTDNGATFNTVYTVTANGGGSRVELEPSVTNANVLYVLSELNQADTAAPTVEVQLLRSANATSATPTFTATALPVGNETRETTYGFTGAQAFYDLMIETDPTNDAIVYVGGIDLYRSANSGASWTTISNWTTDVHSDQHALTFKPGSPNVGVFGNDGGVYYSSSLSTANNGVDRNNGFNVTQFVGMAVMPNGVTGATGDFFVAGAQDNGSQYFSGSTTGATSVAGAAVGVNGTYEVQGGDGGKPLFAQDSDKYYVTNYVQNDSMIFRNVGSTTTRTLNDATSGRGLFYPAMALDSANDIVYSDFTDGANRSYIVRRYSNIKGPTAVARVNLINTTFLTSYPTAITPGKVTPTTLYIGTMNGKVLKLTNANTVTAANSTAGVGWSDITGSAMVGSVSDIEFGANDSQIFVTMHNYGVNNIWYTLNGGTNWYQLDGNLPDLPVKCILQNPLNTAEIMIGTELGVWYANTFNPATAANQALDWKQSFNGMSNVKITDLDLQANLPAAPTAYKVYAATYGRGVFSGTLTALLSTQQHQMVSDSFNVYPTVNNGTVTVASTKYFGETTFELFDITGKKVYSNEVNLDNSEKQLTFPNVTTGNFILKISGEGFEGSKRLIINN